MASAHSRARSKRLNQDNLTALSQSNVDLMSQIRNSQANLNEDLKSNLFTKDGRNSKKSRVQTAVTRNNESFTGQKKSVLSFDALSNGTRNKSFHAQSQIMMNEANFLKAVLLKLKKYHVSPQVLNGVRYEMFRFDTARNNIIYGK